MLAREGNALVDSAGAMLEKGSRLLRHHCGVERLVFAGPQRPALAVVGGEPIVREGELTRADEAEIARAHRAEARRFLP